MQWKNKVLLALVCLATTIVGLQSVAHAGNRSGAITGTVGIGKEYFSPKRNIENVTYPLFMLGYHFNTHWGIEAFWGNFRTKFKPIENDNRHITGTVFAIDGLYHFLPCKAVEPFVLFGVGVTGLNPNLNDANNEGNLNVGVGAQLFAWNSVALRVEARDFYSIIATKNDFMLDAGISVLIDV